MKMIKLMLNDKKVTGYVEENCAIAFNGKAFIFGRITEKTINNIPLMTTTKEIHEEDMAIIGTSLPITWEQLQGLKPAEV